MKPLRILWVSDDPRYIHVGQSRVTREFVYRLQQVHTVGVAGFSPLPVGQPSKDLEVFPILRRKPKELSAVWYHVFKPDVVILSHDIFEFGYLPELRQKSQAKVIGYFTVDAAPLPSFWGRVLGACDSIVSPSWFGRDAIAGLMPTRSPGVVPYGVNRSFWVEANKEKAKEDLNRFLRGMLPHFAIDLHHKKLFLSVGHNQERKGAGAIVRSWPAFAKDKDVCLLYICHSPNVPHAQMVESGFVDVVPLTRTGSAGVIHEQVEEDLLRLLYQASDFLIHPAMGEGFGLTLIESMSCGCVPITTAWSSQLDFCGDNNSILIKDYTLFQGPYGCDRAVITPEVLTSTLERAYLLEGEDYSMLRAGGITTSCRYSWDDSYAAMMRVIESVVEAPKQPRPFITEM